jgi:CRP/FNR family transcriptional regulator, cyclic AMP receptor protein
MRRFGPITAFSATTPSVFNSCSDRSGDRGFPDGRAAGCVLDTFRRVAPSSVARRGQVLYCEGRPVASVSCVESGRICTVSTSRDGRELSLEELVTGDLLGVVEALGNTAAITTAVAAESCVIRSMPRDSFARLMRHEEELAMAVSRILAARLRDSYTKNMELAYESLENRVECALKRLARNFGVKHDNGTMIDRRLKTHELAAIVAASRPRVSLTVQELIRRGRLTRVEGKFVISS